MCIHHKVKFFDRLNGAGVSHLEVLRDFLQVHSPDRCVLVLCSLTYSELV